MPWKKGQPSPNPGGRPKMAGAIRARARIDSQAAYDQLRKSLDNEDPRIAVSAAVHILRLAGVSFASDAEETRAQAEGRALRDVSTEELEAILGHPEEPLN